MPKTFVAVVCLAVLAARPAHAQIFENVGTRAQGMGGAFVAVADDASATWWNPAGLATGAYFNALLDLDRLEARGGDVRGLAFGFPSLGLSYYRLPINQMRAESPTVTPPIGRQDQGVLTVYGMTVGQSLGAHLVLASTLKLVRSDDTAADLDMGAMAKYGVMQLGVTVKNLRKPTLAADSGPLTLERQARAGLALMAPTNSFVNHVALALDADLTRQTTVWGDMRHAAAGFEAWMFGRKFAVRAGGGVNTIGARRATASAGLSLIVSSGQYVKTYLEGQATRGDDPSRQGWSASLRATF